MTAFRGHGFSLLAPARGMPALPAKGDFSRPSSLLLPPGSSDTCYSRKCFRWDEQCTVPGQGRLRQLLHRTKKIGLYFRGANGPSLQTTIVIVIASYTVLLEEIHEDDETPQRVFFASEEAHREPAESVVHFRSGFLYRILYILC